MEREDKEYIKGANSQIQNQPEASKKEKDARSAADDSDVVKDENIPVIYIDTSPDVPKKTNK